MNVNITTRHHSLDPSIREYIDARMKKISRFFDRLASIQVVVDHEHDAHQVEAIANVTAGPQLTAKVEGGDLRGAIDACEHKLEAQLRHWKDKHQDHRPS